LLIEVQVGATAPTILAGFPRSSGYPEDAATGIAAATLAFGLLHDDLIAADDRVGGSRKFVPTGRVFLCPDVPPDRREAAACVVLDLMLVPVILAEPVFHLEDPCRRAEIFAHCYALLSKIFPPSLGEAVALF
jgi:hypothetical protein